MDSLSFKKLNKKFLRIFGMKLWEDSIHKFSILIIDYKFVHFQKKN
jgi:hypothetical protein